MPSEEKGEALVRVFCDCTDEVESERQGFGCMAECEKTGDDRYTCRVCEREVLVSIRQPRER